MTLLRPAGRLSFTMQRLFNRPQLILPEKAEMIIAAVAERCGIASLRIVEQDMAGGYGVREISAAQLGEMSAFGLRGEAAGERYRGYDLVDGIAIIAVEGTLVAKLGTLRPYSGMTGYDGIYANLMAAMNDAEVRGIVLEIDSPGGEGAGLFDFVDDLYAARQASGGSKPIWAILTEQACSAALAIASSADRVIIPRTGYAGSIGAVVLHVDWSQRLKADGVTVTLIHAGKHKVDGNPYEALPDSVRVAVQRELDDLRELFITTVARNRGADAAKLRAQEAAVYRGADAVAQGLADEVMAPLEAFEALVAQVAK